MDNEIDSIIHIAAEENIPIYTSNNNPSLIGRLCYNDYRTNSRYIQEGVFTIRDFCKESEIVKLINCNEIKNLYDTDLLLKRINSKKFIAYFSFVGIKMQLIAQANRYNLHLVKQTGPFSCIFEIR